MTKNTKQAGTLRAVLAKELFLATPIGFYLFVLFGLMTFIPDYPIIVGVGYVILSIFNVDTARRGNRDVEFTCTLPVKRKDVVTSKVVFIVIMQMLTLFCGVIGALIAAFVTAPSGNIVGLDANLTFFGVAFIGYGVFNIIYVPDFFKTGYKSGVPVVKGMIAFLLWYAVAETVINAVPGFASIFDAVFGANIIYRAIVLVVGIALYTILTIVATKRAQKKFERVSF